MGSPLERGGACPCRLRRCALFSLAVVIVFALAPGVCSAAEKGLSVDLTWGTSSSDQDRTAAMLPDTGAKWVRLTFDWSKLQPRRGSFSSSTLATYDRAVSLSRQAGMNVDVTVYNTPKWASANGQTSGPPANNADYASAMSFLANRYLGQVQAWEIWNEENTSRFWSTGPNASAYAGLLRAAYPAVKGADPATTVVFGGTFGNDTTYISSAYQAGAKGYFDAMAVHPYSGSQAPDMPGGWFGGYRGVRNLMLSQGDDKPVWLTEFGWSTTSQANGVGYGAAGEATQADYLTRAYRMIEQDPYVQVAIWYNFRNNFWNKDADGWEYQLGLLYTTFAPKLAYTAFKNYIPGQYVPPANASASSSGAAASTTTSDGRESTLTTLRAVRARASRARASRVTSSTLRVAGSVAGANRGSVVFQIEPVGTASRSRTPMLPGRAVHHDGSFRLATAIPPGRWRVRALFQGSRTANPSASRFLYLRI